MPKPDFTLKFIKDAGDFQRLSALLAALPAFALDIETTEWWNRHRERIALIQIAFRTEKGIKVFIIDALAGFDPEPLRLPLEKSAAVKIIHNAAFDATRLKKHYDFSLTPVFDTMLAARRSGERKYSLKAQAETHLELRLDKSAHSNRQSVSEAKQ
jgi:ribonuclease D